jgi:hypothetical protein
LPASSTTVAGCAPTGGAGCDRTGSATSIRRSARQCANFALRDLAFETPLARRWRKEQEERAREEQEALEAEHQREIECEALKLKAELASLRFELVLAEFRRKANFNANQPRVPAGNVDGGQWLNGEDGARGGDAQPQFVQASSDRLLNNHIVQNHVAKTDEELKARIRADRIRTLFATSVMDRNGSFGSIESARDFISQTIANNPSDVAQVASGQLDGKFLVWRFGYETGREAILDALDSEIRMRPTYEVGVLIIHDPRADFGYRVVTAFPRNFNSRTAR